MGEEDQPGGSAVLGQLIDKYGSELYYDLWCIGIDLYEFVHERSSLSPSRLLAIVENLPEDSATVAAASGGPEYRSWTTTARILADVYDAMSTNTIVSGTWKKNKAPKIPQYPRPWVDRQREEDGGRPKTIQELHGFFSGFINGGGGHQI